MKSFDDFLDAARHIAGGVAASELALDDALDDIGKHLKDKIQDKFGKYQSATAGHPEYPKWAELREATKRDRRMRGYSENEPLLREGNLRDSISYVLDDSLFGGSVTVGTESQIVYFHEVGYYNVRAKVRVKPRATHGPALIESSAYIKGKLGTAVALAYSAGKTSFGTRGPFRLVTL